ncbi:helix-turn-helix domain-containing protein [Solimonas sp. K1W22B-7]|uniref:GlxA family transcriptional regulator n=1 Tax=Solimonas sp. K1W22B-7 TaxID=2303331 RepID=UPI000E330E14|nr:helix-turn-helix domain-containing protein [Solimonas sp. K1W22B-7]AXQ29977.1 helix-turn-helix domain-containing protein [Solimonas sp. K1W22B-7]
MFDFTILVAPGAYASAVAATLDLLSAAAAMAPRVGAATPRWRVRGLVEGPVQLSNGLSIAAKPLTKNARPDSSIWVVPGLATDSPRAVSARLAQPDALRAIRALQVHARAGGTVAASCSGVFLLQAAGLLQGRRATTTWWLAAHLQGLEPGCTVDADRLVISDGPVWTAGAAFAQTDLMLQLLRVRFGVALADAVSRVLLIDGREAQAPFVVPSMLANGNALVAQLSRQIEDALPQVPSIARMAADLCISEKTLARRVRAATGRSTSALVQFVRLRRARLLLETSQMSVEQVAAQVGYRDATALRRLMRKVFAATPRQFRRLES